MTSPAQKPLLPTLWERIKRFFVVCSTDESEGTFATRQRRIRYLKRCLLKDDPIEAIRLQLEHNWEDVST